MTEHICHKEAEIAVIQEKVENIEEMTGQILSSLNGNGKPGIKTRVEVLETRVTFNRYLLGVTIASISGAVTWIIRSAIVA